MSNKMAPSKRAVLLIGTLNMLCHAIDPFGIKESAEKLNKGNADNIALAGKSTTKVVQEFNKEFHEGNAANILLAAAQGKGAGEILIDQARNAAEQAFAASLTTAIVKITGYPTVPGALAAVGSTVKNTHCLPA